MPRPDVTAHLTAISELVVAMGEPSEMPGYYLDVIAIYDRCRSMFGGLRTLLSADFSHEAAVLAGPCSSTRSSWPNWQRPTSRDAPS